MYWVVSGHDLCEVECEQVMFWWVGFVLSRMRLGHQKDGRIHSIQFTALNVKLQVVVCSLTWLSEIQ
jgi:hypothetical protein